MSPSDGEGDDTHLADAAAARGRQESVSSEFDEFETPESPDPDDAQEDAVFEEADDGSAPPPEGDDGEHKDDDELARTPKLTAKTLDGDEPPPATTDKPTAADDNRTLAALAASDAVSSDPNSPSFILVAALRSQITDLTSQVTSLNSKLVSSYTRTGDLEDDLHDRIQQGTKLSARVKELEQDKVKWEKEIEKGGWVERNHVQSEMQRLMYKVMEETKSRETAVQAHDKLETEIENLTSSLFSEANKMVAVERFARARAEEKMTSLEESNADMTGLFEELQDGLREKVELLEAKEAEVATLRRRLAEAGLEDDGDGEPKEKSHDGGEEGAVFSDGKTITKDLAPNSFVTPTRPTLSRQGSRSFLQTRAVPPQLITSVLPYNEFVSFVTYLRQLRVTVLARPPPEQHSYQYQTPYHPAGSRSFGGGVPTPSNIGVVAPPVATPAQLLSTHLPLSSHLSQPFMRRCVEEDSDPSLRLDIAPGLGFLSRRTVGTAILDGTLLIEPVFSGSTLPSATCALCGCGLEKWWAGELPPASNTTAATAKNVNQTMRKVLGGGGWGFGRSTPPSTPPAVTPQHNSPPTPTETGFTLPVLPGQQIHIFRINDTSSSRYAICPNYCLPRLRAVCEFWTYIRAMERGLLLEEGFHFVGGRGVNGALGGSDSRSTSTSSLQAGKSKTSLFAEKSVDNLGLAPADRKVVEIVKDQGEDGQIVKVVLTEDPDEKKEEEVKEEKGEEGESNGTEEKKDEETKEESKDEEKVEEVKDEEKKEDVSEEKKEDVSEEKKEEKSEDAPVKPAVPAIATSPMSRSGSLNKPPVPKRSGARPTTPVLGSGEFAPSTTPAANAAAGTPPKVPPRHQTSVPLSPTGPPKSVSAGAKASELGGTVDAMEIVGGATGWEDRCWAEVVRLKEAVFWSRMAREQPAAE
ncbi:GDP/GTP exchange factor Sec2p [Pseudohyphozyma bogoriensis]|nr:GDP/GTP exchange factor Sec2p [Pseudohyphozyma bogoriensis]